MAISTKPRTQKPKAPSQRTLKAHSAAKRAALDIVTRYGEALKSLSKR